MVLSSFHSRPTALNGGPVTEGAMGSCAPVNAGARVCGCGGGRGGCVPFVGYVQICVDI